MPTRLLINQCQIITFHILKSDIMENSRIELRGIVLPVPSYQIESYIYYYFTLQLGNFGTFVIFFLFHIEIEGNCGWIIGGCKWVCWPPLKLLGRAGLPALPPPAPPPLPLTTPMNIFHDSVCFPRYPTPSKMGSSLKGKKLLL